MALDLTGTLIKVLPEVTGAGKNGTDWKKQEFVVETSEQYPKKVCLSLWGDKIGELKNYNLGDQVTVSLNLESREYNERWYTEARAWRIQRGAVAEGAAPAQPAATPTFATPPANTPATVLPPAMQSFGEEDDLPF